MLAKISLEDKQEKSVIGRGESIIGEGRKRYWYGHCRNTSVGGKENEMELIEDVTP